VNQTRPHRRPVRILLVEDMDDNCLIVELFLKDTDWELDIAQNGRLGVEKYITNNYDLVLMDLSMPVMDGFTAIQAIRRWEQEHGRPAIPILALTALCYDEARQKCFEAGCNAYLTKPIRKATLLSALELWLDHTK
jgi:two-component system sensor histidine kinase/response regulator